MKAIKLLTILALSLGGAGCSKETKGGRQIVVTDASGRTIAVDKLNAGVTNASGDFTATIGIKYPDGTPAAGLGYRLELPLSASNVVARTGILSTNGESAIHGLAGGNPPVMYYLYVEENMVCQVAIDSNSKTNRFEGLLPAKAGMSAPDLALIDLAIKKKFRLSDLHGQIVFLEFYTTPCAPCQPVLAKLNELLQRRGEEWQGKVTILAIGLDAIWQPDISADSVAKHLHRKGWKSLHPVVPDQAFSLEPAKQFPFGVNGVPHSFLIGRDGVILWSGFPDSQEVERRIEHFLNGRPRSL